MSAHRHPCRCNHALPHCLCAAQFKIEPFKHPIKTDPQYGGGQKGRAARAARAAAAVIATWNCARGVLRGMRGNAVARGARARRGSLPGSRCAATNQSRAPVHIVQRIRGRCWRRRFSRLTTTTPAVSVSRSCTGEGQRFVGEHAGRPACGVGHAKYPRGHPIPTDPASTCKDGRKHAWHRPSMPGNGRRGCITAAVPAAPITSWSPTWVPLQPAVE